jgi:hypothetical protein
VTTDWLPDPPPPLSWLGRSFLVTALVPAAVPVGAVAVLVASDAWTGEPHWAAGIDALLAGGWPLGVRLLGVALVLGLMLSLLSPVVTRVFEGSWGHGPLAASLAGAGVARQRGRYARVVHTTRGSGSTSADRYRRFESAEKEATFPTFPQDLRPTALGNAHTRAVLEAGAPYALRMPGMLVPLRLVAEERDALLLDHARLRLDVAVRLVTALLATTLLTTVWLWRAGAWTLVALVPYLAAALLYRAAVSLASEYGAVVNAVLLVNRRTLYSRIGLPPAADLDEERRKNEQLRPAMDYAMPFDLRQVAKADLERGDGAPVNPPDATSPPAAG